MPYVWLAITAHKDKVWRGRAGVDPGFSDGGGGGGGGCANGNAWPHGHGKGECERERPWNLGRVCLILIL